MSSHQTDPPKPPAKPRTRQIWCCGCNATVQARLTNGAEIYPHRFDLDDIPMWVCDACKNYVGCHHKTKHPTDPLGIIPTPELRNARKHIHRLIDPVWRNGAIDRTQLYQRLSAELGYRYHTGSIRTLDEARRVYKVARAIIRSLS